MPSAANDAKSAHGPIDPRSRLIVAPYSGEEVELLLSPELRDTYDVLKIGWPLHVKFGREIVEKVADAGKQIFLDLKFGDIPNTVGQVIEEVIRLGVKFTTVNTSYQTVKAAVDAKGSADLAILTVTVLTSMAQEDLTGMGITKTVDELVEFRVRGALKAGCAGVIASGREAAMIRGVVPPDFLVVTPGIRSSGASHDDHKRATTPGDAIRNGADYLVVGRPIVEAVNPRVAVEAILEEMAAAFESRTSLS